MIKKLLSLSIFFLCISIYSSAQLRSEKLSEPLLQELAKIGSEPAKRLPITLFLQQQVDYVALNAMFIQSKTPIEQRAKTVINAGMALANKTQPDLISFIKKHQPNQKTPTAYWIVNALELEADLSLIVLLSNRYDVASIKWQGEMAVENPEVVHEMDGPESINGTEPGLRAIRAPFLWNLGYTGRNRRAYVYDSGISPSHPSVRRQFLGNRFPLNQAWLSGSAIPADSDGQSNHGTHVSGTVLGLNTAQNDTIGVAFNGYFIANDYVGGSQGSLIGAFQFALNPDGDPNTVNDIPDVINNSWRYTASNNCNSTGEIDAFNALDAAGVAVVFAAGNSGPSVGSISFPAAVVIDTLSVFSVGNLNGNNATFPINTGSSRGPTPCSTNPIMRIKPEVSAPGTSIRSSVFGSSFTNLSGTSMAAPHVSGAVMLLKEAFPNLSGREILNALYQSATDLGTPGKDNSYGKGIINLENAYNFLAASFTPTPPISLVNDISVEIASFTTNKVFSVCESSFSGMPPQGVWAGPVSVTVRNRGQQPINGFTISSLNNGVTYTQSFSQTINVNGQISVAMDSVWLVVGANEAFVVANYHNQITEADTINNRYRITANVLPIRNTPASDNFMTASLINTRFGIISNDNTTWYNDLANGLTSTRRAMIMPMVNYTPRIRQRDDLYTSQYLINNISPSGTDTLILWNMAYKNKSSANRDSLLVEVSCDCGNSWSNVYKTGGDSMQTYTTGTAPSNASHWRLVTIASSDLPTTCYGSNKYVQIRFSTLNDNGGNLYITNLVVFNALGTNVNNINETEQLQIYPNPAQEKVYISFDGISQPKQVQLIDLHGRIIKTLSWENAFNNGLLISDLAKGVYVIRVLGPQKQWVKRIIKQ